jgi:hypothetical protein
MVEKSVEKSVRLVNYQRGSIAAEISARAAAAAVADFGLRRGIRLAADAEAEMFARLTSRLGTAPDHDFATAAIQASVGTSTRVALAGQVDVHGVFAEACATGEARARVTGDLAVTTGDLLEAVGVQLPPGVAAPVQAFLSQVGITGGIYAEVYFAFRARANLVVGGSVIPTSADSNAAAFTVEFNYGYAYIWGAGVSGFLDVELPDVPQIVAIVAESATTQTLRLLPPNTPPSLSSLVRVVLPLATSAAVTIGQALGAPQTRDDAVPADIGDVAHAFLTALRTEGLNLVLTELVSLGVEQATAAIDRALDAATLTEYFRLKATDVIAATRTAIAPLETAQTLPEALTPLVRVCGELTVFFDQVGTAGGADATAMRQAADALTITAAAAAVLGEVVGVDQMAGFPDSTAALIRDALPGSGTLTLGDLVGFLGLRLGAMAPDDLARVGWLADILGASAPTIVELLWNLTSDSATDPAAERAAASQALGGVVQTLKDQLRPFLNQLPPQHEELRKVAAFLAPLLDVLTVALPPLLAGPDNPDGERARRARDEVDTLLTGVFGAMVVNAMDTCLSPYFDSGPEELRRLADRVEHDQRDDPLLAEFFALANGWSVVFRINRTVVAASLRETADILPMARTTAYASGRDLLLGWVQLASGESERIAQLEKLAGSDEPPGGESGLIVRLLDALLGESTEFALRMVPHSLKMSTLISLEQGPVPLSALREEATWVAETTTRTIEDLAATGATIVGIAGDLIATGKVRADALRQLGENLKSLIKDAADVVDHILDRIKEFTWPIFVTSTAGLGFLLREQFDAGFAAADWLIDEIHAALDQLTDYIIEALIAAAQDLGVLDSGSEENLGTLGDVVRQRSLGEAGQAGLEMFDGKVSISHAELAAMVTDAAFTNQTVRAAVRTMHSESVAQAKTSRRLAAVTAHGDDVAEAEARVRAVLTAQQRPTGFVMGVSIDGVNPRALHQSRTHVDVLVTGAEMAFVTGAHPLVNVEFGGWPAAIDPAAWQVEADGRLRGQFTVYSDPYLGAPHPFVRQGAVTLPPQVAALRPAADAAAAAGSLSPEVAAIHDILAEQAAGNAADPAVFLTRPVDRPGPSPAADLTADAFLSPAFWADPTHPRPAPPRFPGVLALDRQQMIAAATTVEMVTALQALPGTPETAFVSAAGFATLGQSGDPTSLVGGDSAADVAAAVSDLSGGSSPVRIAVLARPGTVAVTACVAAVPGPGQDRDTAPNARLAEPMWFQLAGEPLPHDDATFVKQVGVPEVMREGSTAQVSVTMHNFGRTTWRAASGYSLGSTMPRGNDTWGPSSHRLPHDVPPGQNVTFSFTIKAPPTEGAWFQWQMRHQLSAEDVLWFGRPTDAVQVQRETDGAELTWQVRPPPDMKASATATVVVRATNTGTSTWTDAAGHRLVVDGQGLAASTPNGLGQPVPRAAAKEFTFTVTAPPAPDKARVRCQMMHGSYRFGFLEAPVTVWREVTVPSVRGWAMDDAVKKVRSAGLEPVTVWDRPGDELGDDPFVSGQNPPGGARVREGSRVVLRLRTPPQPLSPRLPGPRL